MSKWRKKLKKTIELGQLVQLDRSPEIDYPEDGYIVGMSKRFIMLHLVDTNVVDFDGYVVLRRESIRRYRIREDSNCFLRRALQLKGLHPAAQPQIDLSDLPSILASVNAHFPLFRIDREVKNPDCCYIGRIQKMTDKTVTLDEISPAAEWDDVRSYKLKDITLVWFGGAYEAALALVAPFPTSDALPATS